MLVRARSLANALAFRRATRFPFVCDTRAPTTPLLLAARASYAPTRGLCARYARRAASARRAAMRCSLPRVDCATDNRANAHLLRPSAQCSVALMCQVSVKFIVYFSRLIRARSLPPGTPGRRFKKKSKSKKIDRELRARSGCYAKKSILFRCNRTWRIQWRYSQALIRAQHIF